MTSTNLRLLTVAFDAPIHTWELPAFRGAVAEKAGYEHDLFHNHNNDTGGYHYRFLLIQYTQGHGHPMLVCLNEGLKNYTIFSLSPTGRCCFLVAAPRLSDYIGIGKGCSTGWGVVKGLSRNKT